MSHVKLALRGFTLAASLMVGVAMFSNVSSAAEKQISRVIAKEMTAAQKALQAGKWSEAISNLDAAQGKSGINAFDRSKIFEFKGFAYIKSGNYKAAMQAYEDGIGTGVYSPEEVAKTNKTIFTLAASAQQYSKAIEYGKKLSDAGTLSPADTGVMAQLYYLTKDCKNSVIWSDKAIQAARHAGEAPKENFYQFKLSCASNAGDNPATIAALEDLVKATNKTEYWNSLSRLMLQDEKEDRNILMVYRVMYNVGAMNAGNYYVEMSQLLLDAALPAEAQSVLEKAFASSMIKDDQKERTTRLLNSAKQRADTDRKGLPQYAAEAAKNKVGEASVKLGEVYYSVGDYQNAVKAIQDGFDKGQIKHLDEAYVYLGLAQAALKNSADAKKAFAGLKTVPNMSPRVLKLWELFAEKEV
jgi:tetratricopeptide (TPR) repeat protein